MANQVKRTLVFEYWDCHQCGAKALLGAKEACDSCGRARDKHVRFYRGSGPDVAVDAKDAARHQAGADWLCEYCQSLTAAMLKSCKTCGAVRSVSATPASAQPKATPTTQPKATPTTEPKATPTMQTKAPMAPRSPRQWLNLMVIVAIIAGGGFLALRWSTYEEQLVYEVAAVHWERHIKVDRYVRERHEDWKGEESGDERQVVSTAQKIRKYLKVLDHYETVAYAEQENYESGTKQECSTSYESTGSGAAERVETCVDVPVYAERAVNKTRKEPVYRQDPVYDKWVVYEASRYGFYKTFSASGSDNQPVWPSMQLGVGYSGKPDRKGEATQKLTATMRRQFKSEKAPGKTQVELSESDFLDRYLVGKSIPAVYKNVGGLMFQTSNKNAATAVAH